MKKLLLILMTVLASVALPASLSAFVYQGVEYEPIVEWSDNGQSIVTGNCSVRTSYYNSSGNKALTGDIVLPEHPVDEDGVEYTLTEIQFSAFYDSSITSIEIPSTVVTIGASAFSGCSSLSSIKLPEGLTTIGGSAFNGCRSLSSIKLPEGVVSIGKEAFYECPIKEIAIPSSVTTLGQYSFSSYESLFIGTGLTEESCKKLYACKKVFYPSNLNYFDSWVGSETTVYDPELGWVRHNHYIYSYPEDLKYVFDENGCAWSEDKTALYYVPASYEGDFIIPEGTTTIGASAFAKCSAITSLTIPSSITTVGVDAFAEVEIPRVNFNDWSAWMTNAKLKNINSNPYRHGNAAYAGGMKVNITEFDPDMKEILDYILVGLEFSDEVILPSELRRIGAYSFYNQKNVFAIDLPATVEEIGEYAFACCELLENPFFPETLQSIGDHAYENCNTITEIDFPEGLSYLGASAFEGCASLEKAAMIANITELKDGTFRNCKALYKVYLPTDIVEIGDECFQLCLALDELSFPASLEKIGARAFKLTALKKANLPKGLVSLGESAFEAANIATVSVGGALEEIPTCAFAINSIRELTLSEGLKTIGANAFVSRYNYYNIGDECYRFYPSASIGSLTLPSTVEAIGENAFEGVKFGEFTVNEGIKELAVGSCGLPSVLNLPASLTSIAPRSIDPKGCELKVLTVKSNTPPTLSDALTFSQEVNDNLVMIVNPGRKSYYERSARWKQIENILESGETEITVYMTGLFPITEEIRTTSGLMPAQVTKMTVTGPMTQNDLTLVARNMPNLISLDLSGTTGLTEVGDSEFYQSSLKELVLPEGITRIGREAFRECPMLELSKLPESVTEIDDYAFSYSPRVAFTEFPANLERIDDGAFRECIGLKNLTFGKALESVGTYAFEGCSMLETVDMSATRLTAIGWGVFSGCAILDEVILPETVTRIENEAFRGTDLRDIEFAAGVKEIGARAFADSRRMVTANLPEGLENVADGIFSGNTRLVSASVPASAKTVGTLLFDGCVRVATISSASSTAPSAASNAFQSLRTKYVTLIIPQDAYRAYLNAPEWGRFQTLKNGLPVIIPEEVEVSAVNEEDYQDLLRDDYLEQVAEEAAEEDTPEEEDAPEVADRAARRAAQRAATQEGRSFARVFNGAGLTPGTVTRVFINTKGDQTVAAVLLNNVDITSTMEGNSVVIPVEAAGSLEIRLAESGVEGIGAETVGKIDFAAPYEVYNLSGVKVGNDTTTLAAGMYIIRQNGNSMKMAIK